MVQLELFSDIPIIKIIDLFPITTNCAICDKETLIDYSIPWYEKPVEPGHSENCYMPVCKDCHDSYWEKYY